MNNKNIAKKYQILRKVSIYAIEFLINTNPTNESKHTHHRR